DAVALKFATRADAAAHVKTAGLKDWQVRSLHNKANGLWFMIAPKEFMDRKRELAEEACIDLDDDSRFFPKAAAPVHARRPVSRSGAPTAKSICLAAWEEGIERDAFVAAVMAQGVKESTARTMYSDIKNGRIK